MSVCSWHRKPLTLLLPLLVAAIVVPILIGRCGMSRASASPLGSVEGDEEPPAEVGGGAPGLAAPGSVASLDLGTAHLERGRYMVDTPDGTRVELTLDPALQRHAQEVLARSGAARGAAVFVSIPDGRVLALAGHAHGEQEGARYDLALRAWAPAASVFKIVTSAALLASGGVRPELRVCYHGGTSRLMRENIEDSPRLDRRCGTLADAIGQSTNSIIAKLAHRHLDPDTLAAYARAFGFNATSGTSAAFPVEVEPSVAEMPEDDLEFARTAAGFWHVFLSPLHAARIASAFANKGAMVAPRLVERVRLPDGTLVEPPPLSAEQAIPPDVAREVGRMMVRTTRAGTARSAFVQGRRRLLPFDVAGKTGTLARRAPYTHYNWFVGFAPADNPRVAFAVLVGSTGAPVKAAAVARDVLRDIPGEGPRHDRPGEPRTLLAHR